VRYKYILLPILASIFLPLAVYGADKIKIDVIKNPYGGGRNVPEL
jgi:hypothetical protein